MGPAVSKGFWNKRNEDSNWKFSHFSILLSFSFLSWLQRYRMTNLYIYIYIFFFFLRISTWSSRRGNFLFKWGKELLEATGADKQSLRVRKDCSAVESFFFLGFWRAPLQSQQNQTKLPGESESQQLRPRLVMYSTLEIVHNQVNTTFQNSRVPCLRSPTFRDGSYFSALQSSEVDLQTRMWETSNSQAGWHSWANTSNIAAKGWREDLGTPDKSLSKESACKPGDPGSIYGSGRSPGEGNGYPLQYSCLQNSMDRGARRTTVHGVTKSWTRLKQLTLSLSKNATSLLWGRGQQNTWKSSFS